MSNIRCTKCGSLLNKNDLFCTECGTKIDDYVKIRTVNDFIDIDLYDEIVRTGAPLQSEEELKAIIKEYNTNVNIFKKKGVKQLLLAYKSNLKWAQERLVKQDKSQNDIKHQNKQNHHEKVKQDKSQNNISNSQNDLSQKNLDKHRQREAKLEKKFGTQFHGKKWFSCTLEERRFSTFRNSNDSSLVTGYIILNNEYFEIFKESSFIKTNLGSRKVYLKNIASIDFDKRGIFNLSSSVVINLKSSEFIQLKNISKEDVESLVKIYEDYMMSESILANNSVSTAEELMKYAELFEKGLLTEDEFNKIKKDLLKY